MVFYERGKRVKGDDELLPSLLYTHSKRKIVDVSGFNSCGPKRFSIPLVRIGREEGTQPVLSYILKVLSGS